MTSEFWSGGIGRGAGSGKTIEVLGKVGEGVHGSAGFACSVEGDEGVREGEKEKGEEAA